MLPLELFEAPEKRGLLGGEGVLLLDVVDRGRLDPFAWRALRHAPGETSGRGERLLDQLGDGRRIGLRYERGIRQRVGLLDVRTNAISLPVL